MAGYANNEMIGLTWLWNHVVLTRTEERELLVQFKEDPCPNKRGTARDRLIVCNIRFVAKIAKGTNPSNKDQYPISDRVQSGVLGLIHAIDKFDHTRKNSETGRHLRLSTYAAWWIRCYIDHNLGSGASLIRIPMRIKPALITYTEPALNF